MNGMKNADDRKWSSYLSAAGAWALMFGCSVGWGAYVMPGNTFLPVAGPAGTALGLGIGALIMLILAAVYHYMINLYPDNGGTYTFTKKCFGYDHGFLCAWFLILTYIAIIWANASALPLIARTLIGSTFQFGFHYEIAGFHVYFGEILLSLGSIAAAAIICLRQKRSQSVQVLMAGLLFSGVVICFVAAALNGGRTHMFNPPFHPGHTPLNETFTIFALAPWAYVGFESVCHSSAEAAYPLKRTFRIMALALVTAGLAYVMLGLLATTAMPDGNANWLQYTESLGNYSGIESQPAFFAAKSALGTAGSVILGISALGAIFTGLIGNFVTLSRLLCAVADDGLLSGWIGKTDENHVPRHAILCILAISSIFPFLGRTAISWIVDVTTVGATIAYAFASASALKTARGRQETGMQVISGIGLVVSVLFALEFLIPNLISVKTLSTESYLILAAWGIIGFMVSLQCMKKDRERRLGRSSVAWIVLLALIMFTSTIWMRQVTDQAVERSVVPIQTYYMDKLEEAGVDMVSGATRQPLSYISDVLNEIGKSVGVAIAIQVLLIVTSLAILFMIYSIMQKRERQIEVEKLLAEESSRAKTSFLSNMSHEIRTPMNAIIGLDNIALRDPDLMPRTREQLEKIGASARHLLGLINDILDMSRIESGRMVLKDEEFSFREFIDQINIIINGQCQDKGLHYQCDIIGNTRDYYVGDDMKLKQVLINILGNSVKFTEAPGDVKLSVQTLSDADGNAVLRFAMKDTGIGMDAEYIPKIFEAFSQEDATTTNRYGGSGLGMAITKNFVEMMKGEIEVQSKKGVGSTFIVTIPLKTSERVAYNEHGITLPDGLRAVVVDDDEISGEHAQIVLKSIGVESTVFTVPEEALAELRRAYESGTPYPLLITDYKMPGMNGLDLARTLHEFDNDETAIILLTGYNWDIIEDEAKNARVDSITAKPLFTDSLQRTIHQVLEHRSGAAVVDSGEDTADDTGKLAGLRILMAEDVDANAEILTDLLDLEEIESERAVNGQKAVEIFSEKPAGYYDAILMDVRMPVMDGLSATRAIRALERPDAKTIPIIAMTANVFDEDVERSLAAGMNAHLSKPIEPDRLYAKLAELACKESK